jgi:hypothetical protein
VARWDGGGFIHQRPIMGVSGGQKETCLTLVGRSGIIRGNRHTAEQAGEKHRLPHGVDRRKGVRLVSNQAEVVGRFVRGYVEVLRHNP